MDVGAGGITVAVGGAAAVAEGVGVCIEVGVGGSGVAVGAA